MKQILFITSGSIGDAVISTGILGWLIDQHPEAEFTIAAGVASAPLFLPCPQARKVLPIKKLPMNRHWINLWKQTRFTDWDIVVDLRGSLLSYVIPCKKRYVFSKPDKSLPKAQQLSAMLGIAPPPTRLWVSQEGRAKAQALLPAHPFYVMAPKTNSTAKDWPIERFVEVAKHLHQHNPELACIVLATKEQQESVRPLTETLTKEYMIDLCGGTDLPTAIAVLQKAELFIGNDSGLLHMSAALGRPAVGIYGPSNDKTYAPRASHVKILTTHDFSPGEPEKRDISYMLKMPAPTVMQAVRELNLATVKA